MPQENYHHFESNQDEIKISIQRLIESLPNPDRDTAIENAKKRKDAFLTQIWQRELSQLPASVVKTAKLTPDLAGWERYLQHMFSLRIYRGENQSLAEWSAQYTMQMLQDLHTDSEFRSPKHWKVTSSYYRCFRQGSGVNPEIWWGKLLPLNPDSLLVHAIAPEFLAQAIQSGTLGRGGVAWLAMSQDRVVEDRGYVVIFQANELQAVGYPLLRVNSYENEQEWRSALPIDLGLARAVLSTESFPDRDQASQTQLADSFYGEEFLKQLPRL